MRLFRRKKTTEINPSLMEKMLPVEIMLLAFSFLDYKDLKTCGLVSKTWQVLSKEDTIFKSKGYANEFELKKTALGKKRHGNSNFYLDNNRNKEYLEIAKNFLKKDLLRFQFLGTSEDWSESHIKKSINHEGKEHRASNAKVGMYFDLDSYLKSMNNRYYQDLFNEKNIIVFVAPTQKQLDDLSVFLDPSQILVIYTKDNENLDVSHQGLTYRQTLPEGLANTEALFNHAYHQLRELATKDVVLLEQALKPQLVRRR